MGVNMQTTTYFVENLYENLHISSRFRPVYRHETSKEMQGRNKITISDNQTANRLQPSKGIVQLLIQFISFGIVNNN